MFEKDFNETVENINNFWADMFEMVGMEKEEKEEKKRLTLTRGMI